MSQITPVPGPSQADFDALNGKIANIFKTKTDTATIDANGYFTTTTKSSDCLIVGIKTFIFGGYVRNAYKYETLRYGGDGNVYNGIKFRYWDDSVLGKEQQATVTYVYISMP